ncbi:MAG: NADPH cytochrome P450 oxidoreductase family protein [Chitinophagaceae bacterium]|nr:NADPH cytochrome P450 oxidoreductase family protein [Chitinophagaceae bacterium]
MLKKKITHEIKAPASEVPDERTAVADFSIMQQTTLAQVNSIEFPFVDDDPEEYFTLKLKDREIVLNQFDGSILSEINSPASASLTTLSLNLHTGKTSIIWAIIIGIASINILFFIYSGFGITLRRRKHRIQNKYKAAEANYVILVGSENGSTLFFAGSIHQQLLAQKKLSYLGELNGYTSFPKAEHLIIFTSTYGLGDAPGNASHFSKLLASIPQDHPVKVSVVGFGSYAYKDFCAYAQEIDEQLSNQSWAEPFLEMHTVNDKSPVEFTEWVKKWSEKTGLVLTTTAASYNPTPAGLHKFRVIARTTVSGPDESFIITLQPLKSTRFISGDLLAIYPAGDHRERFYSIGKMDGNIQLVVKYHQNGIGSEFLNALTTGATIEGRISASTDFHFPAKAPAVIMISNGTGIAPFLGMLQENVNKTATRLYAGFRKETALTNGYRKFADEQIKEGRLQSLQLAFSREGNQCYVMDLIKQDADFFATQLENSAVIMICGSLNMQRDVEAVISGICFARHKKQIEDYKKNGQILTDCY